MGLMALIEEHILPSVDGNNLLSFIARSVNMQTVYNKDGNAIKLQEFEDTGWEPLYENSNYAIAGRIVNGIATIRMYNVSMTPENLNGATKIIDLPERYHSSRVINFVASRYAIDPKPVVGYIQNTEMYLYFNTAGTAPYYGFVSYPVD